MAGSTPQPRAGGALLAVSLMAGAGLGLAAGEPTFGLLAGFGVGVLLCLAIWAADRRAGR